MAEGLIKSRLPEKIAGKVAVSSAGTHAFHGNMAQPYAVDAMREYGVDIGGHRARQLNRTLVSSADLILVMEKFHLSFVKKKSWFQRVDIRLLTEFDPDGDMCDVPDPMGEPLAAYQDSARIINNCVQGVCAHIESILEDR